MKSLLLAMTMVVATEAQAEGSQKSITSQNNELAAITAKVDDIPMTKRSQDDATDLGYTVDEVKSVIRTLPLSSLRMKYLSHRETLEKHVYFIVDAPTKVGSNPMKLYVKFKMSPENDGIKLLSFHKNGDFGHVERAKPKAESSSANTNAAFKKAS